MIARRNRLASRSVRRLTQHAIAAVLLAGVAVVATGGGAGAASSDKPESFGGKSAASSMQYRVDKQPFPFPVTDPFHTWVPYAGTTLDSSGASEGIASSVYPGQGFIGVPKLICIFAAALCEQLPGGAPPEYPDWAHAQYPAHPDDAATLSQKPFPGTGPFEISPNSVEAHAAADQVEAKTVTGSAGLTGVVTADSAFATSNQHFEDGALVLTADSVLRGVDIAGQLHIDEIRSTATAKLDGSKVGTASAVTTVSGATLAGQAVAIDSTGIHAAGQGDNGQANQAINSALKALAAQGITMKSLGTSNDANPSKVAAETGGVLVIAKQSVDAPGLPGIGETENGDYTITVTLGGAGINAFASPAAPAGGGFQIPPVPTTPGGVTAPPPASVPGGTTPPADTAVTGSAPAAQQPAVASNGAQTPVALPTDLTNKRLKTLALVLLGYPLLVLIGAPLRAPSRLPRAR